jgi:hypothetical protein
VVWPTQRGPADWAKLRALFAAIGHIARQTDEWDVANEVQAIPPGARRQPGPTALVMELPAGGDVARARPHLEQIKAATA